VVIEQLDQAGRVFTGFALPMVAQSSLIVTVLLLANVLIRRRVRATLRYWLWMAVPLQLVVPVHVRLPEVLADFLASKVTDFTAAAPPGQAALAGSLAAVDITWRALAVTLWLITVAVLAAIFLGRIVLSRRIIAKARDGNSLMKGVLWYCRKCMGLRRKVGLKVTPDVKTTVIRGLLQPVILVPQRLAPNLGSRHLRSVLLHEVSHLKRADRWSGLALGFIRVVYFYHPMLWVAARIIGRIRDEAADELVMNIMDDKADWYQQTLVNTRRFVSNRSHEQAPVV